MPPTDQEIKANALRFAGNTWRRFVAYRRRYMKKYGNVASEPTGHAYFNNRLFEDTFARTDDPNHLPNGKQIESRQRMATSIMDFRASLHDPSKFDEIYATSLSRRMPGYIVEVSRAMSASVAIHEKDSIRTFVTKMQ
ncbi:MAG: hypothetical protein EOT05_03475 [Candidatus Microsaccharimonas sossegonensis]|uniref:Uncharacterized protein n=1 Tax=Candidatus Microsaccharimonas sossegonensis TaxID=2506948 RepID=A0A4Q0AIB2_9BACT|nr:MAG: hypothetical protein EOT05_03475 [Candidatus Microsaccharimonas sossegonensis]